MKPVIQIKRIYEEPSKTDGYRILVDRLWPRGFTKSDAAIHKWAKDLAPTASLRKWFDHSPEKWAAFSVKYKAELNARGAWSKFQEEHAKHKQLTLIYAGKDKKHTHALVLKEFLEELFQPNL